MGSGGQPQQWKREDRPQRQQEQKQPGASPKVAPATVSTGGARAALARSLVGVLPLATGLSWCANYKRGHQSGCSCWSPAAGGMLPSVLPLPASAKGRRATLARPSVGVLPLVAGRGWCAEQRTTSRGAPASGLAVPTASSFCVTWRPLSPVGVCSSAKEGGRGESVGRREERGGGRAEGTGSKEPREFASTANAVSSSSGSIGDRDVEVAASSPCSLPPLVALLHGHFPSWSAPSLEASCPPGPPVGDFGRLSLPPQPSCPAVASSTLARGVACVGVRCAGV